MKAWLSEPDRPLTNQDRAELAESYAILDAATMDDTGLPDDYADEIDHYLYGTPKRNRPPANSHP